MTIEFPAEVLGKLTDEQRHAIENMSMEEETAFLLDYMGKDTEDAIEYIIQCLSEYRKTDRKRSAVTLAVVLTAMKPDDSSIMAKLRGLVLHEYTVMMYSGVTPDSNESMTRQRGIADAVLHNLPEDVKNEMRARKASSGTSDRR